MTQPSARRIALFAVAAALTVALGLVAPVFLRSPQRHSSSPNTSGPPGTTVEELLKAPYEFQAPVVRVSGYYMQAELGLELAGIVPGAAVLFASRTDAENCDTRRALMVVPSDQFEPGTLPDAAEVEIVGRFRRPQRNSEFPGIIDLVAPPTVKPGARSVRNCMVHAPAMQPKPSALPPNNSSKPTPLRGAA